MATSTGLAEPTNMRRMTSDHLDTVVVDPHDNHHPLDEEDHQRQRPHRQTGDASSDRTLHIPGKEQPDQKQAGNASDPEKGQLKKRDRAATQTTQPSIDPETREWKDDIITFDSKDDPANPKNWPYR